MKLLGKKTWWNCNSCLQFANKNSILDAGKRNKRPVFFGRISRRKIWKIMFPEWWELRAACCSRLQLETYKWTWLVQSPLVFRGLENSWKIYSFWIPNNKRQSNSPLIPLADTDLSQNFLHLRSFDDINVLSANGCLALKISEKMYSIDCYSPPPHNTNQKSTRIE